MIKFKHIYGSLFVGRNTLRETMSKLTAQSLWKVKVLRHLFPLKKEVAQENTWNVDKTAKTEHHTVWRRFLRYVLVVVFVVDVSRSLSSHLSFGHMRPPPRSAPLTAHACSIPLSKRFHKMGRREAYIKLTERMPNLHVFACIYIYIYVLSESENVYVCVYVCVCSRVWVLIHAHGPLPVSRRQPDETRWL